ncbi:MAG: glutathione peroxidase [Hyphomicrobiales bacterium]|nr:glutathione peroxidase [Hyphomicrobiales bacterium]
MKLKQMVLGGLAVGAALMQSSGQAQPQAEGRAFTFAFEAINGKPMPLSDFKGRVLLVVNTASFCGFTGQYEGLQTLWQTYKDHGLTVIGVPSNDFYQESGDAAEIANFCKGTFGVTFPLTAKYSVTGANAHPFYQWANSAAGKKGSVGWNFHKFLISADGKLAAYFPTNMKPTSKSVIAAIEAELAKREKS